MLSFSGDEKETYVRNKVVFLHSVPGGAMLQHPLPKQLKPLRTLPVSPFPLKYGGS